MISNNIHNTVQRVYYYSLINYNVVGLIWVIRNINILNLKCLLFIIILCVT